MTKYTVAFPPRRLATARMTQLATPGNTIGNDQDDALTRGIDTTTDGRLGHY